MSVTQREQQDEGESDGSRDRMSPSKYSGTERGDEGIVHWRRRRRRRGTNKETVSSPSPLGFIRLLEYRIDTLIQAIECVVEIASVQIITYFDDQLRWQRLKLRYDHLDQINGTGIDSLIDPARFLCAQRDFGHLKYCLELGEFILSGSSSGAQMSSAHVTLAMETPPAEAAQTQSRAARVVKVINRSDLHWSLFIQSETNEVKMRERSN